MCCIDYTDLVSLVTIAGDLPPVGNVDYGHAGTLQEGDTCPSIVCVGQIYRAGIPLAGCACHSQPRPHYTTCLTHTQDAEKQTDKDKAKIREAEQKHLGHLGGRTLMSADQTPAYKGWLEHNSRIVNHYCQYKICQQDMLAPMLHYGNGVSLKDCATSDTLPHLPYKTAT